MIFSALDAVRTRRKSAPVAVFARAFHEEIRDASFGFFGGVGWTLGCKLGLSTLHEFRIAILAYIVAD